MNFMAESVCKNGCELVDGHGRTAGGRTDGRTNGRGADGWADGRMGGRSGGVQVRFGHDPEPYGSILSL